MLSALVLVPFLGKAFTIDDVTFLLEARHVLSDPFHPAAFDMVFDGDRIRLSSELATGPVMAYMLAPIVNSGKAEYLAHFVQLLLVAASVIATASLAQKLGVSKPQAVVSTLLVVASPAVLGMASTAMPDVPAMAFGIIGIERFVAWHRDRGLQRGAAAAAFLALAVLSRSHTLSLIPIAWMVAHYNAKNSNRATVQSRSTVVGILPLVGALLAVIAMVVVTRDPASGRDLLRATTHRVELRRPLLNFSSYLLHWALMFPLVALWIPVRGKNFFMVGRTCVAAILAFALALTGGYLSSGILRGVILLLLILLCADVLLDIALDGIKRRDYLQLALFAWIVAPSAAIVYVQLPAKLLLFSAPAMGILVSRRTAWTFGRNFQTAWLIGVVTVGFLTSLLVLTADQALAEIGREGGDVISEQVRAGNKVWADGTWGFQWYAMKAGATPLARTAPFPEPGDVIVSSIRGRLRSRFFPSATLISRKLFSRPGGRIHGEGAGFYTNVAGPLPWTWGTKEISRIEVWRLDSVK